jgi:hypothetical protein
MNTQTESADAAIAYFHEHLPGWTSWGLRTRRRMTSYMAEVARLSPHHDDEDRAYASGTTPLEAMQVAVQRAKALEASPSTATETPPATP